MYVYEVWEHACLFTIEMGKNPSTAQGDEVFDGRQNGPGHFGSSIRAEVDFARPATLCGCFCLSMAGEESSGALLGTATRTVAEPAMSKALLGILKRSNSRGRSPSG